MAMKMGRELCREKERDERERELGLQRKYKGLNHKKNPHR
eukprot:CAMPEP_0198290872 /NCGR_PEP_ID=MMETSP1449-20131203/8580_1 /TAXON_ID=420275 /ORGANISM="Attheya septentrionalis, Strain CCMP2084" /LENGTH=39 /DNA_ID= /DNA_START= /DNA_END= /DNA_ORIENTATION=